MKIKAKMLTYPLSILGVLLMLTSSCKKKDDNNNTLPASKIPVLTTDSVSNITHTTAICGGQVTSDGGATVTTRGVCWNTSSNPNTASNHTTDGVGTGTFVSNLTGLTPNSLYYVRAYATNSAGTSYGNEVTFTPLMLSAPTITTPDATNITNTSATSGGNITSDGGATVTTRGVCWNTSSNPTTANSYTTDGSGTGTFVSNLTALTPNTVYYVRAYATNIVETAYGNQVSVFTPLLSDIDGNFYHAVTIGAQEWMIENLKTSRFDDGTAIPLITDGTTWSNLNTPGYCWYNNDIAYKITYGAYYNGYTVDNPKLCPTGWHIPDDQDWTTLITYLGGAGIAGGKMKEIGLSHWASPNAGATNSSGFTALPGGRRFSDGSFHNISWNANFWSFTATNYYNLIWQNTVVYTIPIYLEKTSGYSVRCIKDN